MKSFDDYFWPEQRCMKNLLGIHNPIDLETAVNDFVSVRAVLFLSGKKVLPARKFTPKFVLECHRVLFQDCYDWAGEYRECAMGRNIDYAAPEDIPKLTREFCSDFRKGFLNCKFANQSDLAAALAGYWGWLNAIHCFRDGNGRSQALFFTMACRSIGYDLIFEKRDLSSVRVARDSASEQRPSLLGNMIFRGLSELRPDRGGFFRR